MSETRSTLSAHNLKKRYKKRTVVHDVSFEVVSGEVVGLLGPNGAGKTTCFYMVVGLVACDGGDVHLDDSKFTHLPIHKRAQLGISYLPQEASVFRKLNVSENIKAVLELQNLSAEDIDTRLETLLGELHINHIRISAAAALSGGERRRVEIARALATNPSFILLDEPFTGVDPIAIGDIQDVSFFAGKIGVDIGCGPRGSLCWMQSARERIGVDPLAERYLEFGVSQHNMVYVAAPAEKIPLISGCADIVTSFYALHYVESIRRAWAEIRRIVKPGGCFIGAMNLVGEASRREPSVITLAKARTHFFSGWNVEYEKVIPEGESLGPAHTYKFLNEDPPPGYHPRYSILCCRIRKPAAVASA